MAKTSTILAAAMAVAKAQEDLIKAFEVFVEYHAVNAYGKYTTTPVAVVCDMCYIVYFTDEEEYDEEDDIIYEENFDDSYDDYTPVETRSIKGKRCYSKEEKRSLRGKIHTKQTSEQCKKHKERIVKRQNKKAFLSQKQEVSIDYLEFMQELNHELAKADIIYDTGCDRYAIL